MLLSNASPIPHIANRHTFNNLLQTYISWLHRGLVTPNVPKENLHAQLAPAFTGLMPFLSPNQQC